MVPETKTDKIKRIIRSFGANGTIDQVKKEIRRQGFSADPSIVYRARRQIYGCIHPPTPAVVIPTPLLPVAQPAMPEPRVAEVRTVEVRLEEVKTTSVVEMIRAAREFIQKAGGKDNALALISEL